MKLFISSIATLMLLLSSINAQVQNHDRLKWKPYPTHNYRFRNITYNPANDKLYAINNESVYSSSDNGINWIQKSQKAVLIGSIDNFKADSKGNLYYSNNYHQLLISKDDGTSFDSIHNTTYDFIIDSKDNIYALSIELCILYYSYNQGVSWDSVLIPEQISNMMIDDDNDIYMTSLISYRTDSNYHAIGGFNNVYKFNNFSKKIEFIASSELVDSTKKRIITGFESDHNNYYFLCSYYSLDSTEKAVNPSLTVMNKKNKMIIRNILPLQFNDHIYNYNFDINRLYFNNHKELFLIADNSIYFLNQNFAICDSALLDNEVNRSLQAYILKFPNKDIIIFNSDMLSTYISVDAGHNWMRYDKNINSRDYYILVYSNKDSFLLAVDDKNVIRKTTDDGWTWLNVSYNFDKEKKITSISQNKYGFIIAGTEKNGVFILPDDKKWVQMNDYFHVNKIIEGQNNEVYFCTDEGLYVSIDDCYSYRKICDYPAKDLLITDSGWFLTTRDGRLFKFSVAYFNITKSEQILSQYYVTSLAMSRQNVMIAGTKNKGVFRTFDFGDSWHDAKQGLFCSEINMLISSTYNDFFAIAQSGIFYSKNNADSWEKVEDLPRYKTLCFNKTNLGGIFNNFSEFSKLETVSNEPMKEEIRWENIGNYNRLNISDYDILNSILSSDGRYSYFCCKNDSNYNKFYLKVDTKTGSLIDEKLTLNDDIEEFYCMDEDGNLACLKWRPTNTISLFNCIDNTIVTNFFPTTGGEPRSISVLFAYMDKTNKNIYFLTERYNFNTKAKSRQLMIYDYNGALKDTFNLNYFQSPNISSNYSLLFYIDFTRVLNRFTQNEIHQSTFKILDIKNSKIYESDTLPCTTLKLAEFFDNNMKLCLLYTDTLYLYRIDSLREKFKPVLYAKLYFPVDTFHIIGNRIIGVKKDKDLNLFNSIKLFDIEKERTIQKSSLNLTPLKISIFLYEPVQQNILCYNSTKSTYLYKFYIDSLFDTYILDFSSDKNSCTTDDIISFSADSVPQIQDYFWDFGNGEVGQGAIIQHRYKLPGTYSVKLKYYNGVAEDSVYKENYITVKKATIVEENNNSLDVSLSPNPASEYLNINIQSAYNAEIKLSIFDILGNEVLNSCNDIAIGQNSIKLLLGNLSSGSYTTIIESMGKKYEMRFVVAR